MTSKKGKSKSSQILAIEDLIAHLGLLDEDVWAWIKKDNPEISKDYRGRPSVPITFLKKYSESEEYNDAFKRAVAKESYDVHTYSQDSNKKCKDERLKLLDEYSDYIDILEKTHRKYLGAVNGKGYESSAMAAYLLFSRVISTLKLCVFCQRNDYWYWGSLLREIDECLAVAVYFVICSNTVEGDTALHKRFRQNHAPGHADCRKAIAANMHSVDETYSEEENHGLVYELYQKKSKLTHPTYLFIREVTKYKCNPNNSPVVEKVEYGVYDNQRKHFEVTEFFQSHILSSFLTFRQCFRNLSLDVDDAVLLKNICDKINDKEAEAYRKRNQS